MRSHFSFIVLLSALVLLGGCASKRLTKKGKEHEQAGFYQEAASYYYQALLKNDDNLDAKIGLKGTGQQVLDDMLQSFMNQYNKEKSDNAVYAYQDAMNYYERVKLVGVNLNFPESYNAYFQEVKRDHLSGSYEKGYRLLTQENFRDAEKLFAEIYEIEPGYKDVKELLTEARFEPVFLSAKKAMDEEKYRTAYDHFEEILLHSEYKNAASLKDQCLEKGRVTIAILPLKNNTGNPRAAEEMRARLESKLDRMTNPFLRVVEYSPANNKLQQHSLEPAGSSRKPISTMQLNGAKAFLQGTLIAYGSHEGALRHDEKRGYVRHEYKVKNRETGKTETRVSYDKVTYEEVEKENSASCSFSFKLTSAETGEVLASDMFSDHATDRMHYVIFDGKGDKLVPGYWRYKRRDSKEDFISKDYTDIRRLRHLTKADKSVKPVATLSEQVMENVALKAARTVNAYNPE